MNKKIIQYEDKLNAAEASNELIQYKQRIKCGSGTMKTIMFSSSCYLFTSRCALAIQFRFIFRMFLPRFQFPSFIIVFIIFELRKKSCIRFNGQQFFSFGWPILFYTPLDHLARMYVSHVIMTSVLIPFKCKSLVSLLAASSFMTAWINNIHFLDWLHS